MPVEKSGLESNPFNWKIDWEPSQTNIYVVKFTF